MRKNLNKVIIIFALALTACGNKTTQPVENIINDAIATVSPVTDDKSEKENRNDEPADTPKPTETAELTRPAEKEEIVGDMAKYERIISAYLEGNLEKQGGPYVMPTVYSAEEYFAFVDINGDGREELLIGCPSATSNLSEIHIEHVELFVPGDSFEESDLQGGIDEINLEKGVVKLRSDEIEVDYLKLEDDELKPYITYVLDFESEMGPAGIYNKYMADGSSSKVSGAEALGSQEGFAKVGNLNVTWIYLDYDNFSETINAKTNE